MLYRNKGETNHTMQDISFLRQTSEHRMQGLTHSHPKSRDKPNLKACEVRLFYLRVECVGGTEAQDGAQLVMVSRVMVMSSSPYSVCDRQRDGPQLVPNVFLMKWEQKSSYGPVSSDIIMRLLWSDITETLLSCYEMQLQLWLQGVCFGTMQQSLNPLFNVQSVDFSQHVP